MGEGVIGRGVKGNLDGIVDAGKLDGGGIEDGAADGGVMGLDFFQLLRLGR